MAAGIKAAHAGFKRQPEFLLEIAAGRVHFGVGGLRPSLSFIKNGQLLPLAVTTLKRAPLLPDVPTATKVIPGWGATVRKAYSRHRKRHVPSCI